MAALLHLTDQGARAPLRQRAARPHQMTESSYARRPRWPLFSALLLLALSLPAQAETYRMDLIVFVDRYASGEAGRPAQLPNLAGAVLPDSGIL